jgi:hypothetical protein
LRSKILLSDNEENAFNKSKCVPEHKRFQLAVVGAAPESSFQKSPADLHFAFEWIQIAVPGASNDSARFPFDDGKGAFGFDRPVEEFLKDISFIPVAFRMLFPDERIARGGKERVEVFLPQGTYLNKMSFQRRLKIEFQIQCCLEMKRNAAA